VNTAIHEEPRLLSFGWNCLGVEGHVEAEESAVGRTVFGFGAERGVFWGGDPTRWRQGDSCDAFGVETFDMVLVRASESLW
jgi:hypothetical protein